MKDYESLKKNKDFQLVYRKGTSYANRYLVMYVLKNELGYNRVGVSVSKKVGNSIVRHRLARLIRESYRLNREKVNDGYDIIFVSRVALRGKAYKDTEKSMLHLIKMHALLKEGY